MPLRCIQPSGESLHAFDLSDADWAVLVAENRTAKHLRMPCCQSSVTLKTSSRGTRFFAHRKRGECITAPETEEHLTLKRLAIQAARKNGWEAEAEVEGMSPLGAWRADVLAKKGARQVALEVQWSAQCSQTTADRQDRYRACGVEGVWLLRQPGFPISRDLPAVCIGGDVAAGFTALLPKDQDVAPRHRTDPGKWLQSVSMDQFLDALFGQRFWFGLPVGSTAKLRLIGGYVDCHKCGAEGPVLAHIEVSSEHDCYWRSLRGWGKSKELWPELRQLLRRSNPSFKIFYRRTAKGNHILSNACVHCGTLIGERYTRWLLETHCIVPFTVTREWRRAIRKSKDYDARWRVFPLPDGTAA